MFCEHPNGKYPCGKCRACKLKKVNEKMIISVFAAHEYRKKGQFLTLTYNDEHLPDGLYYPDFSGFMKRLRRLDGTPYVKLYVAGEYGEKSGREHFHVLFYNHRYDIELVKRAWRDPVTGQDIGFVYDGTLTPKSMKYVSGYVSKRGYDPESGKRPPFGRMSCKLPDGLSEDEILNMCRTGLISYNGRKFLVPTTWRRRYRELWKATQPARAYNQAFDAEGNRREKKDCKPEVVSAMMDDRERHIAQKRKKKRIMYIMYTSWYKLRFLLVCTTV